MSDPPPATLDVVIVSFRCKALLHSCLSSLRDHPGSRQMNLHVVDNASADGTVEMVGREFPGVRLRALDRNVGFAAANNLVLRELSAPFVLVLNPDTRLREETLERLQIVLDARPEIGIIGPRLELDDGSFDHAARRSFPTPLSALGHFTGVGRRRGSGRLAAYRAPSVSAGPVDAVNGAFMLIRRTALEEVGLFDARYWMYMEDLDLCYRFGQRGWITWYEPTATAIHVKGGSTTGGRGTRLQVAFHSGMERFYRDHYAAGRSRILNGAVHAGIAGKLGLALSRTAARRLCRLVRPPSAAKR